jgi:hypothetical protein
MSINQCDSESFTGHREAQNFAIFAFDRDLERPATDFAIGREPLVGDAHIDGHIERLAAVRTLDGGELFHEGILRPRGQSAKR